MCEWMRVFCSIGSYCISKLCRKYQLFLPVQCHSWMILECSELFLLACFYAVFNVVLGGCLLVLNRKLKRPKRKTINLDHCELYSGTPAGFNLDFKTLSLWMAAYSCDTAESYCCLLFQLFVGEYSLHPALFVLCVFKNLFRWFRVREWYEWMWIHFANLFVQFKIYLLDWFSLICVHTHTHTHKKICL